MLKVRSPIGLLHLSTRNLCPTGTLVSEDSYPLSVSGQIKGGYFVLPGNISSQFVSGLLMAAPLMEQDLEVLVTEPVESAPYIDLTCSVLAKFGVGVEKTHVTENDTEYLRFYVSDNVRYQTPAFSKSKVTGQMQPFGLLQGPWLGCGSYGPQHAKQTG